MKKNNFPIIQIIIFVLYTFFTFVLLLHHEIWADEAQAWLVVRDLNITGIFEHVRTEGHPLLWYMTLFPFAKIDFARAGIFSMQLINWALVVFAMGIYIFKSPFRTFTKASVLLGSGFLYWYAVIARSYCFIPLFVFLIAIYYPKQKEHPFIYALLIILLANTHLIMFGFCVALTLIFAYNNRDKKSIIAACLMFASFLCISVYLFGSQNENYIVKNAYRLPFLESIKEVFKRMVFNLYGSENLFYTLVLTLFLTFSGIFFYLKSNAIFFVYTFNLIYQFALYVLVWGQLPQRTYSLYLVIIFCFWVIYKDLNQKGRISRIAVNLLITAAFLASVPEALSLVKKDMQGYFSDGKNTAEFIKKNIPKDAFIVSNYPLTTVSVSAYLPQNKGKWRFWYQGYKDYYTYALWDKTIYPSYAQLPLEDFLKKHKDFYVILSAGSIYLDLEPVYSSGADVYTNQERFIIYHIKGK